jgi:AcrR family transcriptional regulator
MPQPKTSSDKRKEQILAAARSLFARRGYGDVTLDDIAAKVGISRPRVVQLFGSKLKIYEAIANTAYRSHPLDKDLAEPMKRKDDFEVFRAFAAHILGHTAKGEDREIFKILMYARLREDQFHRVHFHEKDTLMISRLLQYVSDRIEAGTFRPIDPRTVIFCYQAMISNLVVYKNVMKRMDFVSIEDLSRSCAAIFLEGLKPNGGRPTV